MNAEESELQATRQRRTRRVKRWLRLLPRRATIHRYPVLSYFAEAAKKRIYLWSFRVEHAVPAIYAGCILTPMPLYGIQMLLGFFLALWLRANLPILLGLQWVSNPFTVIPIWYVAYRIGRNIMRLVGVNVLPLRREEVRVLLDNFMLGNWGSNVERILTVFGVTSLGALVIGSFFGFIGSIAYRIIANRTTASYALLKEKLHTRSEQKSDTSPNDPQDQE
ncbi:MAG: DUF2062 domain-containing protein [Opitutales bacterium]